MARAVTPPPPRQRKVKKGAQVATPCECWNCGIIRNFFGKLRSKKVLKTKFKPPLCKTSVLENILGRFVFGNKSPPSPRRFPEKVLLSGKDFEGVPEWYPNFLIHPPSQPDTARRDPGFFHLFVTITY